VTPAGKTISHARILGAMIWNVNDRQGIPFLFSALPRHSSLVSIVFATGRTDPHHGNEQQADPGQLDSWLGTGGG
jgi:hypothetical protein